MNRPDLISTFTKIELWRQTQFSRIVYLDCDIVALRAPDELLSLDTHFAAVPDVGWPDCFNSGVMVLRPNMQDYYSLRALAERGISFDGADQGLFNMHFKKWDKLSFTYNCTPSANYQYIPAFKHFESTIGLLHFIGPQKPWTTPRHAFQGDIPYGQLLGRWWAVYDRHYRPQVSVGAGDNLSIPNIEQTRSITVEPARQPFGVSRHDAPMDTEAFSGRPRAPSLVFHAADPDELIAPPEVSSYHSPQDSAISFGDGSDIPESTSRAPLDAGEPKVSVVPPYHSTTAKRVTLPEPSDAPTHPSHTHEVDDTTAKRVALPNPSDAPTPTHPSQTHEVDEWHKPIVAQAITQHRVARETAASDTEKVPVPLGSFQPPKPPYVPLQTQLPMHTSSPRRTPTDAVESRFFDKHPTESGYSEPMRQPSTFHEQHKSHRDATAYSPVRSVVPQYVCGEEHVPVYFQPIYRQPETPPQLETDWHVQSPSHWFQQAQQHGNVPIPDFSQPPGGPSSTPYARPFSPPKMEWDAAR
jgi:glycogenin